MQVVLNASNTYGVPIFELPENVTDYLTDADVNKLVWGIAQARGVLASAPMSLQANDEVYPGPSYAIDDESLRGWVRSTAYVYSHWAGTVRMGNNADGCTADGPGDCDNASIDASAADPSLRVRGTDNLFVADASVMPNVPNGNVHSVVAMIGYRAANILAGMVFSDGNN